MSTARRSQALCLTAREPCTVFVTTHVEVENLGITEPTALLNFHSMEVVEINKEAPPFAAAIRRETTTWHVEPNPG